MATENMSFETLTKQEEVRYITSDKKGYGIKGAQGELLWQRMTRLPNIVGYGDAYSHTNHAVAYMPPKAVDVGDKIKMERLIAGGEPYISVIEARVRANRAERGLEVKIKQSVKSPQVATQERVTDLINKLKNHFSTQKQTRKEQKMSCSAKYIWNNSVDAFLRHHEKSKVAIKYNVDTGDRPVDGLYTFAVQPCMINKYEVKQNSASCATSTNKYGSSKESNNIKADVTENAGLGDSIGRNVIIGELTTSPDNRSSGSTENKYAAVKITEDDCDDSAFGIFSVYRRSELHSGCCTV